jgi:hypothetical protein
LAEFSNAGTNAYIVDKILGYRKLILSEIRNRSGKRNKDLIQEWIDEYERHKKLLNLTGSIVLLCRDLNFTHGEYKDAIDHHLSIPIKAAGIPDRAYDMHTHEGRKKGRGLDFFFKVSGTVKNKRNELKDDWEEVGKDAFYRADREKLANDDKIIKAIQKKCKAPIELLTID